MIISKKKRTYIGITTDLEKRIRQHNGLIKGGAKATRIDTDWMYRVVVGGFYGKSDAQSFEWHWKRTKVSSKQTVRTAAHKRLTSSLLLLMSDKWSYLHYLPWTEWESYNLYLN